MERVLIAEATRHLDSILQVLDNAYWEASAVPHKDTIYDLISILHLEINELAKLSINDHNMAYEPITAEFRNSQHKLHRLQSHIADWITRSQTAKRLEDELPRLIALLHKAP